MRTKAHTMNHPNAMRHAAVAAVRPSCERQWKQESIFAGYLLPTDGRAGP